MKIPGLEKWRFLICTLYSVSGQVTCSRIERQSMTELLPRWEMASREVRSSYSRKTTKDGLKREELSFFFFYFVLLL